MTADVITLPNVLAQRIRSAYERTERGRQEWIEGTLELAVTLSEARVGFPSNAAFAAWLGQNELDSFGHQDRAALINMAGDLQLTRRVLEETKRISWRHIWCEEMEHLTRVGKTDLLSTPSVIPAILPAPQVNPASETTAVSTPKSKPLKRDHPFHGFDRGDEVTAIYASVDARTTIGKAVRGRGGKEIWALILQAVDAGFLTRTETQFATMNLRILFPCIPKAFGNRFDLIAPKDRQKVRDDIMPAALANRTAILASPERMEFILIAHGRAQEDAARNRAAKRRVDDALRAMPVSQREVIMFGERVWPRVDHRLGSYEYDQLCAAIWYFSDLNSWLESSTSGASAKSRAIIIRLSTRWPEEYIDRACDGDARAKMKKVYSLVHTITRLLEDNPGAECVMPPTPKIEGQW